jgi:arylsulfatase A-like enzyme
VVNPPDVNELYDLHADPYELHNVYDHPAYADVQRELMARLYERLVEVGDNFHHWLPTMYNVEPRSDPRARN